MRSQIALNAVLTWRYVDPDPSSWVTSVDKPKALYSVVVLTPLGIDHRVLVAQRVVAVGGAHVLAPNVLAAVEQSVEEVIIPGTAG